MFFVEQGLDTSIVCYEVGLQIDTNWTVEKFVQQVFRRLEGGFWIVLDLFLFLGCGGLGAKNIFDNDGWSLCNMR